MKRIASATLSRTSSIALLDLREVERRDVGVRLDHVALQPARAPPRPRRARAARSCAAPRRAAPRGTPRRSWARSAPTPPRAGTATRVASVTPWTSQTISSPSSSRSSRARPASTEIGTGPSRSALPFAGPPPGARRRAAPTAAACRDSCCGTRGAAPSARGRFASSSIAEQLGDGAALRATGSASARSGRRARSSGPTAVTRAVDAVALVRLDVEEDQVRPRGARGRRAARAAGCAGPARASPSRNAPKPSASTTVSVWFAGR